MPLTNQETPALDEKLWNAWLQKTKQRERQTAQRMKGFAGVVVSVITIAAAVFFFGN